MISSPKCSTADLGFPEAAQKEEEEVGIKRKFAPREEDLVVGKVERKSSRRMTDYDVHLRKFRYFFVMHGF